MYYACHANEQTVTYGQMNLIFNTRILWRALATWTGAYILSRCSGMDNDDEILERLNKVPYEFENIFQLIFGDAAAQGYTQLLSEHVKLIKDLIDSQLSRNDDQAGEDIQKLFKNADDRAKFLSSVNPYWNETELKNLFFTYVSRTVDEITNCLTAEYKKMIDNFDRLLVHADTMGDYFSEGLFNYMSSGMQGDGKHNPTQSGNYYNILL
jgi:hypothetical protein